MTTGSDFALNYSDALRWLLVAVGLGPRRVRIRLESDLLDVHTAYFATRVPISTITSVDSGPASRLALAGVHTDVGGAWVINGGPGALVMLTLDPPARASMLGIDVTVRHLALGLAEPDAFRSELDRLRRAAP